MPRNFLNRNLDVLRAIAVLAVVTDHLSSNVLHARGYRFADALGQGGVLFFFVHTCRVLLPSLERNEGKGLVSRFYVRRGLRIYPLSIACIVVALAFHIPDLPWHLFHWNGWRDVLANLTLTQNITGGASILKPLWSLPWEVQMYLLLPFIFILLERAGSVRLTIVLWAILSLLACGTAAAHASTASYYLAFLPCFFGGVVAYEAAKTWRPRIPAIAWIPALICLLCVHCWVWGLEDRLHGFPIRHVDSCILCLTVGVLAAQFQELRESALTATSHLIAKYSYGIYLFHIPIMWLAFVKLHSLAPGARFAIFAILMILVPWALFQCIEDPFVQLGRALTSSRAPKQGALSHS